MKKTVSIRSILGGKSPTRYMGAEGQFPGSIAVDPDFPISSTDVLTSGMLVPTVYEKFSGANVTSSVIAIINNPKNTLTYVVTSGGRLISYSSSLGSETLIGTVTGSTASGAFYYNNYIYITGTNSGVDVARYGPLNNSPALTNGVWTGATLGSLTALTNTTYPTIRSVSIPNHWGCIHGDGSAYFLDFINGQGMIHRINTRRVTDEGDTNGTTVPSAYNVLDLPFGFYPVSIASYSTDLAILTMQTTDSTVSQGKAALFLWDPTNTDTFYRGPIYLPDPIATALLYANGVLYIFTGNAQDGMRMSAYSGGDTVEDVVFLEEGVPPFAGAVESMGNRVIWGGATTYPATTASVLSYGSKNPKLPKGAQNIIRTTSAGTTPIVTALKVVQQSSNVQPKPIVAWKDGTTQGVDKLSTSNTYASFIDLPLIPVGRKFKIIRIRIPVGAAITTNMTLTPTVFIDDGSASTALNTINSTNYNGRRKVIYKAPDLASLGGHNNFYLRLAWTGTVQLPVLLPIEFDLEIYEDESNSD